MHITLGKSMGRVPLKPEPMQFAQSILAGVTQNFPREGSDSPHSNRPPPPLHSGSEVHSGLLGFECLSTPTRR